MINATDTNLETSNTLSFFVNPIRGAGAQSNVLSYTPEGEIISLGNLYVDNTNSLVSTNMITALGFAGDGSQLTNIHAVYYETAGELFADQHQQYSGRFYYTRNAAYQYRGTTNGDLSDYILIQSTDPRSDFRMKEKILFDTRNVSHIYVGYNALVNSGYISNLNSNSTYNATLFNGWNGRGIVRTSGFSIKIPENTSGLVLFRLNDRGGKFYVHYDDQYGLEYIGSYGVLSCQNQHIPTPLGSHMYSPDNANPNFHASTYINLPVDPRQRQIRVWVAGVYVDQYISGFAFANANSNPWCYTFTCPDSYTTDRDVTYNTALLVDGTRRQLELWSGGYYYGSKMFQSSGNTLYGFHVPCISKVDSYFYIFTRGNPAGAEHLYTYFAINGMPLERSSFHKINNPVNDAFNNAENTCFAIFIPSSYIRMNYNDLGGEIPTMQFIQYIPNGGGAGTSYTYGHGFVRAYLDDTPVYITSNI